ncbi:YczE/YyaS/YitT family protein [Paenibacillus sp. 1P07SE]|uniref:YczE/YyaS/YitT family protein n=1 Tax=Paenibacillus sp. 1P07SE TaxID=3132209 RepID=UPI0039A4F07A
MKAGMLKWIFYLAGIGILSFGIALTITSDLGVTPFDATLVGLTQSVGLTVGSWEIILAFVLIFFNALLGRQRPHFAGLATAFVTGVGIDGWLYALHQLELSATAVRGAGFALGLLCIGLGTAMYLHTRVAPIPVDGLMLVMRQRTRMTIGMARTLIYFVFLLFALLLGGPIGLGTVLSVCLGGVILAYMAKYIERLARAGTPV